MLSRLVFPALVAALIAIPFTSPAAAEPKPTKNFTLTDASGKAWALHDQKAKAVVLAFLSTECPMANGYLPVLADIAAKYADKGVTLIGVFPDSELTAKDLAAHVKEYKIPFPVFTDAKQVSVAALGPKVTPEVVVLDDTFAVRYRGRIDDRYAARLKPKPVVNRQDLTIALDELLAGKPVSVASTEAFGCTITTIEKKLPANETPVTYYRDVQPIFQKHCESCHRPGQAGPFALTNFKQSTKWADLCLEEAKAKRMPPWKPAPNALLAGERTVPPESLAVLEKWIEQGMPEGDPKHATATKYTDDWSFGEPDLVLEAPSETTIAASGPDHFRVIVFPTNLPEDKYIAAIEVMPGNPRIVHHTVELIDTLGVARKLQDEAKAKAKPDDPDRGPGYPINMGFGFVPDLSSALGGWAPGMLPKMLPDGVGQRLPKGADICVHVHYHRTGKIEKDRTKLGLYFSKKPVTQRFTWVPVSGLFWAIPAGAKDYKVETSWRLPDDLTVYRVLPHMHLLGKDIELFATLPGEKERSLIRIPVWDYNWQEMYELKEPMKLPKGTVLRVRATYDNSADNPNNPSSPPKIVRLGEQTTSEMCIVALGGASSAPFPQILWPVIGK